MRVYRHDALAGSAPPGTGCAEVHPTERTWLTGSHASSMKGGLSCSKPLMSLASWFRLRDTTTPET